MKRKVFPLFLFSLMLCGCTKIEDSPPSLEYLSESLSRISETETSVTAESTAKSSEFSESITVTVTADVNETTSASEYDTEWDPAFYENSLFFGDSICRALSVYNGLVDPERVAAAGGAAARNLDEFTFLLNDIEYTVSSAAEAMKPDRVYLWFGMNDINMTEKDVYVQNIDHLAKEINTASPDSEIIIIGITPTASYHEWGANPRIREYNLAAKEYAEETELPVEFIDVTDVLSDSEGYLLPDCDGGDGLHLTELALQRVLSEVYNTFGSDSADGTDTEESVSGTEITKVPEQGGSDSTQ